MSLPYMLEDRDPVDPRRGWERTWAFLEELDNYIEGYPSGSRLLFRALSDGSVDLVCSTVREHFEFWRTRDDPRTISLLPQKKSYLIRRGYFLGVPKEVTLDRLHLLAEMVSFLLSPSAQASIVCEGFLPGAVLKDLKTEVSTAPSQNLEAQLGIGDQIRFINSCVAKLPLDRRMLAFATQRWAREIGSEDRASLNRYTR
jgi:putative spermidine/putrescine transport system substrate-binding protein